MNSQLTTEQREWLEAFCTGQISEVAFRAFEAALLESADFRQATRAYLAMDSHLKDSGAVDLPVLPRVGSSGSPGSPAFWRRPMVLLSSALLALLLFVLGLGVGQILPDESAPTPLVLENAHNGLATVKHAANAVWKTEGGNREVQAGEVLSPGPLHLLEGEVVLQFYQGASMLMQGDVQLDLKSVDCVLCSSGKLRVHVPESARGFRLLSPQFVLVDLGTEFGVEIDSGGTAEVAVFDGEVEVYPVTTSKEKSSMTLLTTGEGLAWSSSGETSGLVPSPDRFGSFDQVRQLSAARKLDRVASWTAWNTSVLNDPNLLLHYDFEDTATVLPDRSRSAHHGTIVGCEMSSGRWPDKGALQFTRPGDRVRLHVPGEFDQLTLAAWIRQDAQTGRIQSLLLSDGYDLGCLHWQLSPTGNLRLGTRIPSDTDHVMGTGYGSPVVLDERLIGTWNFVATVYDSPQGQVIHYFNGVEVSREKILYNQPIQIRTAELGNWGVPFRPLLKPISYHLVRNFQGRIDSLTMWRSSLSPEAISEIYQSTRP